MRGLLIEDTLKTGFDDWAHWLAVDRAVVVPSERVEPLTPFTRVSGRDAGWQWRIPTQQRTGNGHVYSSRFMSDDEAANILMSTLDGAALDDPRTIRFRTGRRRKAWNKNVVAIGLSSGFLEPLESTSIHFISSGIAKLLSLFPDKDCDPVTAEQFNRVFAQDMEVVRDFLILHYHVTERPGAFWDYCREMTIPDELAYKLAHFRRSGRIVLGTDELFREASWFAVLMGQGVRPVDYNPLADAWPAQQNLDHLANIRHAVRSACERMASHDSFFPPEPAGAAAGD
jgi:tryptophan halogenase